MLTKSEKALGYRVKNLSPINGGSFIQILNVYFHYLFTLCSLYVHCMLSICSLYVHYIQAKSENAFGYRFESLTPKNGGSFMQVFTVYFHYLFTICSQYLPLK